MPRNGSGVFSPPPANYPAVSATTITAANRNAIDADIATALTNSIAVNGESVVTADIPFGNNKLTGVKDGTLAKDAANVSQIQNSNAILLATVDGTDTITASLSPALTAYANGQIFTLIPANSNTGAVTININGLGAKALTKNGSTALVTGDLVAGVTYSLQYDGTRFQKIAGSDYAKSGANSDITSLTAVTSLTSVTSITAATVTVAPGDLVYVKDASDGDKLKVVSAQSIADLYNLTNGPSFSAYQSVAQSLPPTTLIKLQFNQEEWDTDSCFDNVTNFRFTPTKAGIYSVTGAWSAASAVGYHDLMLYKNGVVYKVLVVDESTSAAFAKGSCQVSLNGTTDYIELYASNGAAGAQNTVPNSAYTYFQATFLRAL